MKLSPKGFTILALLPIVLAAAQAGAAKGNM
jgi:hypothetical protein